VQSAMVYVIQVCRQLSSRIRMEHSSILILLESCRAARNIIEFHFQNKFEKLVHLVGFNTRKLEGGNERH
jgi:hypothetical protein